MNYWDIALIVLVSIMGTAVAYVRHPEHKAFLLMLPVPFTLATLGLGRPVDATNMLGMGLLFGFTIGVWALHVRCRWPIIPAIALCVGGYCFFGMGIAKLNPSGDMAFWCSTALMLVVSISLIRLLPYRKEPHYRTPLPVWIKLPAIALVISGLVTIKQHLGGFTTMFPMVGLVAAYEARNSLWTIVRRIPWVIVIMIPVMAFIRLAQDWVGILAAVAMSWLILFALLWALRDYYTGGED